MWIGVGLQARSFGALVGTPDLRPAQKETLLGSEAVEVFGTRIPFQGFFVGGVGDSQAAEVADAFAEHKLAVLMQAGLDLVGVELFFDAGGALVKIFSVIGGPPVTQISLSVELRSLIVKAVGDFVADYGAHAAVIDGVVGLGVVEGRLQDAGGKDDFVHGGVVVGGDGGRRHAPLVAVHGLPDFCKFASVFKRGGAAQIDGVRGAFDVELGIIAPLIGVADLNIEGLEFFDGGLFCFRVHPGKCGDIGTQGRDKILHHLAGMGLGLRRKIFFDVHLAESFADVAIGGLYAAFPARLKLGGAGKALAVEIKVFLYEGVAESRRIVVDHVPAQISFTVGSR